MADLGVDLTDVDAGAGFSPIPGGVYLLQAVAGDVKENSKGTGTLAEFTFEVLEGDYQGAKIYERINVKHQSVRAQQIGQETLAAFRDACELPRGTRNTDDFLYQPFRAEVGIETYKNKHGNDAERNVISKYLFQTDAQSPPANKPAAAPAQPQNSSTRPPQAAANGGGRNVPWKH